MKDSKIFIDHIWESINYIENFTKGVSTNKFNEDRKLQSAVIRELEVIGEASKNLPKRFREKHSFIEWRLISGMRDKLIHHYFGLDLNLVWKVVKEEIPLLKKKIKEIKKEEKW